MDLKNPYEAYGQACINFEIAQNRMMEIKRLIAEEMNKPKSSSIIEAEIV